MLTVFQYRRIWAASLFRVSQDAQQLWLPRLAGVGPQLVSIVGANIGHHEGSSCCSCHFLSIWKMILRLFLGKANSPNPRSLKIVSCPKRSVCPFPLQFSKGIGISMPPTRPQHFVVITIVSSREPPWYTSWPTSSEAEHWQKVFARSSISKVLAYARMGMWVQSLEPTDEPGSVVSAHISSSAEETEASLGLAG